MPIWSFHWDRNHAEKMRLYYDFVGAFRLLKKAFPWHPDRSEGHLRMFCFFRLSFYRRQNTNTVIVWWWGGEVGIKVATIMGIQWWQNDLLENRWADDLRVSSPGWAVAEAGCNETADEGETDQGYFRSHPLESIESQQPKKMKHTDQDQEYKTNERNDCSWFGGEKKSKKCKFNEKIKQVFGWNIL